MTLAAQLDDRLARSLAAAEAAAADADLDGTVGAQVRLEAALDDLRNYRTLSDSLDDIVARTSPYRAERRSWFGDMFHASAGRDRDAEARLRAHATTEKRSTSGAFGGLVVPSYLIDDVRPVGRSGRNLADLLSRPMPDEGMGIYIAKVTDSAGADVAEQANENDSVAAQTDFEVEDGVTLPLRTLVSRIRVPRQFIDRASRAEDAIVARELLGARDGALGSKLESVLVAELVAASGAATVAYTDASPTAAEFVTKVGAAAITATANRGGQAPDVVVVHPRRWLWLLATLGAAEGVTPYAPTGSNPSVVGRILGIDVVTTAAIPTNVGAGENEDVVMLFRRDDVAFYEAPPAVRAVADTSTAANLEVIIEAAQYFAVSPDLYGDAVVKLSGTGLVAPSL